MIALNNKNINIECGGDTFSNCRYTCEEIRKWNLPFKACLFNDKKVLEGKSKSMSKCIVVKRHGQRIVLRKEKAESECRDKCEKIQKKKKLFRECLFNGRSLFSSRNS